MSIISRACQSKNKRLALHLFLPRVVQVIDQTNRRVLQFQKVPSSEKLVSLFESHTDIICRGKTNVLVEFGHKVWLDEVDGVIISNYPCALWESS